MDVIPKMRINVYKRVEIPSAKELFDLYGESPSRGNYTATMDSEDVPVVTGFQTKLEQVASGSQILRAEVAREQQRAQEALAKERASKAVENAPNGSPDIPPK